MDATHLPAFVLSSNGDEVTGRLLEFSKLCSMFVEETKEGRDPSVKIMIKLTKYPPIRGAPTLNNLFELIKDSVFAHQMAKTEVTGDFHDDIRSHQSAAGDPLTDPPPVHSDVSVVRKNYSSFLQRKTMSACKKLFWELKQICYDHQFALQHLQEAIEAYQEMNGKCTKALEELQTSTQEFYASTFATEGRIKVGQASLNNHLRCTKAANEHKVYEEKTKQAFQKLEPLFEIERKIRQEKMNKIDEELRSLIEPEIRGILIDGIKNLLKIASSSPFPEELLEEIETFDCHATAAKLYKDLTLKYFHPMIDESYADMAMAGSSYAVPYFYDMDKDERRFRAHGSTHCLFEGDKHGMRREELYVWANNTLSNKKETAQLKLKTDTKIKQKFCSADGNLAFGWIRKFACGSKKYGFYPAVATRLVL